ncbi:carnosine N-methyltransferase-like [Amphibalanus amphitrite]|nr:carnosine N-methyltransferase-like isoform X2 [Amphibalanus amphitrite]XP_043200417.1 carnosine N-methyltransferase-like isoform X2 [Amphibalanus amphitrite]XP_043200419.1 carnosine N-methyltransferase-like isoform X2 [Amphibalanus amphitrite]XP_043228180.1 carnosine N-methyltransferase-like [Amphibalanus amphitrite]XP_043228181.1 carnosine N-methyltransferase-like [Amphibalanus amphitrite]
MNAIKPCSEEEGMSNGVNSGPEEDDPVDQERQEREHFQRVINAFKYYRVHFLGKIEKNETFMSLMTTRQRELLTDYAEHLRQLRVCVEHNHEIIKLILQDVGVMFENSRHDEQEFRGLSRPNLSEMEKVSSVLRQVVRDWSVEGEAERRQCYQPIVDEIQRRFPPTGDTPLSSIQVLVPGAGLGRLAFEIAKLGYACQGNEFALFMLFASNFVLNRCRGTHLYRLHPWCTTHANHLSPEHQAAAVTFPDTDPSQMPADALFSMAAGDFLEVYTEPAQWHCVATCFFIDCASNIVQFIETIYSILRPGGVWINMGPLLYHYSDMPSEESIEPTYQHLRKIITAVGFTFEKEEQGVQTAYCQNQDSMLHWSYNSVFFVCKKPS